MPITLGLRTDAILLDQPATSLADVLDAAASALAVQTCVDRTVIRAALELIAEDSDALLGAGVAIPHIAVPGLPEHAISLVRTTQPIDIGAYDGVPVDLFFVILYPAGNSTGHLQFLAHLASVCRSRVFRDGLRAAASPQEVLALVAAAESRLGGKALAAAPIADRRGLAIITVSGERAADSVLVGLIRAGVASATIVDTQTLEEAASREVPLFAGFRDLFGDPGGRRMIFAHVDLDRASALATIVQEACEDERSATADLVVVPIANHWVWGDAPTAPAGTGGH